MDGLKGGVGVVVGQVATRKVSGLATKYIPGMSTGTIAYIGSSLIGAVVSAMVAHKFARRWATPITYGAFAEVVSRGLAQTPIAGYLSDTPTAVTRLRARPGLGALGPGGGMGAYPLMGAYPENGIPEGVAA